jgi:hypothetical protein
MTFERSSQAASYATAADSSSRIPAALPDIDAVTRFT